MRNNRGQVIVEYLLIMVLMVAVAALLTKRLVGRGEDDNQGVIVKSWSRMIKAVGNDLPDCAKQTTYNTANCPN
ncbi:hypothetical protein CIK05_04880 [Bdellovibrio sp. qaytius]|nr:hypothetical protein CIK05_04880 [Bdellovibrio sp. qaytius]